MSRTIGIICLVIFVLLILVVWIMGPSSVGAVDPSSSPSASPSPTATATPIPPASAELVAWAIKWRRAARRERAPVARALRCMGSKPPKALAARPARSASHDEWQSAGRAWKKAAKRYPGVLARLIDRMCHPGGSGVERWRALVRWTWPRHCVGTVLGIMARESGGKPRILCGGYVLPKGAGDGEPDGRAGGLMQCKPAPRHWADPLYNLWYAFHRKYLPALRQWGNGWAPWAVY
jgi:hypothetical protein